MKSQIYAPGIVPFFMFDLYNLQLITTQTIPEGDISDSKLIVLAESPIPGLNFQPVSVGGMGNRKISFTLPLVKRDNMVGNIAMIKQFENLRNQAWGGGITGLFDQQAQFTPNPKVLFYWGAGLGVPCEFYVSKCDFVHTSAFTNRIGYPQYSKVSIELILDETTLLYQAESMYRKIMSFVGEIQGLMNIGSVPSI